jgi:hypothetical protein
MSAMKSARRNRLSSKSDGSEELLNLLQQHNRHNHHRDSANSSRQEDAVYSPEHDDHPHEKRAEGLAEPEHHAVDRKEYGSALVGGKPYKNRLRTGHVDPGPETVDNGRSKKHPEFWVGRDDSGKPVSSGVYISRLQMGNKVAVGRMLLLK